METFTASRTIDVPAPVAWAVVADYARDPEWRGGVLEMGSDPAGTVVVGATTHEVLRLAGRTYRNDGVVTALDPGRRFEWRTTAGADAHGARTVRALGAGACEVSLVLHVEPHGLNRLLAPLLRPALARGLRDDLDRLAAVLAAVPTPT